MKSYQLSGVLALAVFLIAGCSHLRSSSDEKYCTGLLQTDANTPAYVIVLPFENRTDRPELAGEVRTSFYNHFSSKNYYDFELEEVDRALAVLEQQYGQPWHRIPDRELGKFFNADFIVRGEVTGFRRIFLGLYSQVALSVRVSMTETRSGRLAWEEDMTKRSHKGDLPLNPLALFSTSLRCGLLMRKERTDDLIDNACRKLAAHIPDRRPPEISDALVDLQVASFRQKPRASELMDEIRKLGFAPRMERVLLNKKIWHRVLLGPYRPVEAVRVRRMLSPQHQVRPIIIHHASLDAAVAQRTR